MMRFYSAIFAIGLSILGAGHARANTVTLNSLKDVTLISDPGPELALGAAYSFYVGRVGENGYGTLRRGLIQFDFQSIPPGSVVTSVQLKLYLSQAGSSIAATINLKRALMSWGEGASFGFGGGGAPAMSGDATWTSRFYPGQPWTTPGGDFSSVVSASKSVTSVAWYTWGSVARLVADVQQWVDQPTTNFGWGVIGNEVALHSVKKFDAHELGVNAPQLIVIYTPPPAIPADINNDGVVNGVDLAILLGAWGSANAAADIDNDGIVAGSDLALLLAAW